MIKIVANAVVALAVASLIVLPDEARAAGRGRGHSGAHSGHHHHQGRGAVLIGSAPLYPWPYSHYYYPLWEGLQEPGVYVEQFSGTPTPDTKGWIYCPEKSASYPDVTECPRGWQRVFLPEQATRQTPAPY